MDEVSNVHRCVLTYRLSGGGGDKEENEYKG